jgi:hypothetical protein
MPASPAANQGSSAGDRFGWRMIASRIARSENINPGLMRWQSTIMVKHHAPES